MFPDRFAALLCGLILAAVGAEADEPDPAQSNPDGNQGKRGLALWEVGGGAAAAYTPNYPAARGMNFNALPVPIVIYRGRFLRAGDGSIVSGHLFSSERLELDVSLSGSFDADSDDVDIRRGMPDLGFLFEVGPELEVRLNDPASTDAVVKLELPLRAAFSVDDGNLTSRGLVFNPGVEYERAGLFGEGSEVSVEISASFATKKLMNYFYAVEPRFATTSRPAYAAESGYLGAALGVNFSQRRRNRFLVAGVRLHHHNGAANEASPLFESASNWSVFAGVFWSLWESERRAPK